MIVLAPVICLGLWASVWVAINTAQNIDHTDPDGGAYIGTADQIRGWHGPSAPSPYKYDQFSPSEAIAFNGHVPSTQFPPGYPSAMAAVSTVTGGTRSAAWVINVVLAFVNVVLVGLLAARMTAFRSVFAATAPALLVLLVPDRLAFDGPGWLGSYLGVYSEPLFIFAVTAIFIALYVVVLVATRSFLDITTRYGARLLSPIRGIVYAVLVAIAYRVLVAYLRKSVVILMLALPIALLVHADWGTERFWFDHAFSARRQTTATERVLAALPRHSLIVTNAPFVAYLTAGRASFTLPQGRVFLTNKPNPAYKHQLAEWVRILRRRGGYGFFIRQFVAITSPDELGQKVPVVLISRSGDESLYRIGPL